jgi:hypothetical protein
VQRCEQEKGQWCEGQRDMNKRNNNERKDTNDKRQW